MFLPRDLFLDTLVFGLSFRESEMHDHGRTKRGSLSKHLVFTKLNSLSSKPNSLRVLKPSA